MTQVGKKIKEISKDKSGSCTHMSKGGDKLILDKVDLRAKSIEWYDFLLLRHCVHSDDIRMVTMSQIILCQST